MKRKPNLVYIFADQMRAQATGFAGDPNVATPYLDGLSRQSIQFTTAVSNCPICTPYRACLLTGQYPLSHGLFMNDLCLPSDRPTLAKIYRDAGYDTAYVGKWHLDGHGRKSYIPPERRQGFDYWKVLECTHDYLDSWFYEDDNERHKVWDGYDALAQARDAAAYIRSRETSEKPFILVVSFGPPHNPYDRIPDDYSCRYEPAAISLRPNVPPELEDKARRDLAGYYAHITALDDCTRIIDSALRDTGLSEETIFVFTSDHGDSMESNCSPEYPGVNKQRPYDESILVPFLLRLPGGPAEGHTVSTPFATPDILPTLLRLSGIEIPETVEGIDFSPAVLGTGMVDQEASLIANYSPFSDWRTERGGRAYRGVRTERFTYARAVSGPWLLFDNRADPYQLENLIGNSSYADLERDLETRLQMILTGQDDEFLPAGELRKRWGYTVLERTEAIPYGD